MKKIEIGDTVTTTAGRTFVVQGIVSAAEPLDLEAVRTMIGAGEPGEPEIVVTFVRDLDRRDEANFATRAAGGPNPEDNDNVIWGT